MFSNYFKTAWRNLLGNKTHSIINIAGLSVGIACSLLIFLWVQNEISVDAFHANNARLYKVYEREYYKDHTDGNYDMPGLLAQELKRNMPEVEDAVMMQDDNHTAALQAGEKIIKAEGTAAGAGLFTMFSYPLLQGNAASALNTPVNIALSQNIAEALFGNAENAVGKTVRFNNKHDYTVSAVFKNLPLNASRRFDYVISWDAWLQDNEWAKDWGNSGPIAFVLLRNNADAKLVDKKLTHFTDTYNKPGDAYHVELGLQKFDEVYLHNHFTNGKVDGGRIQYVHLFSIIAVFILLIACINFMNLATARSVKRAKEVGVRKAIGALRSSLIRQFIIEALLLTIFAVSIALLLSIFLLPVFSQVTQKQLQFPFADVSFWLYIIIITLTTGLVAGSYPALYLSSFNPVKVLKSATQLSTGAVWFRKGLVVLQFSLSLVLILGTIVVSRQVNFIQNRNIGYDKENLVYIPMQGDLRKNYNTFKNEALKLNGVQSVSCITNNPTHSDQQTNGVDWEGRNPNTLISVEHPSVGYDFVQTMKLQLVAGRDFSKDFSAAENGFLLNETAVKAIGYKNPVGKFITINGKKGKITGVLKDFNFRSLHEPIEPMMIELETNNNVYYALLRIEVGKTKAALTGIEKLCKELNPAFPFAYSFSDEEYQKLYQNEQVIGNLSNAFAGLAIFISCLGLLGLIMFTAEQRTKEIGIRKVLGASVQNILRLLSADLLMLVFIAIIIATPISWWAMHNWLNDYAYKTDISWWLFAAAAGMVVLIALLTISFQSIKAAVANPVKSLRSE